MLKLKLLCVRQNKPAYDTFVYNYWVHQILWRQLEYIDAPEKLSFDVILVFCVENYL